MSAKYVESSVRLQNEIISNVILDVDKLRGMIVKIHQEQMHIKRTFLGPQLDVHIPPEYRPMSVPNKPSPRAIKIARPISSHQKLPKIPRPPTAPRPPSRAPRKMPSRPVIIF
jgi:hypothetical protein